MDFWDAILQICGLVSHGYDCFRGLEHKVTTLTKETGKLKRKREEVEDEVRAAESGGKKRRCEVGHWLQDVDEIVPEVESIQLEFERGTTNPLSRYRLSKRVVEKTEVVKALQDKGVFDEVARSPCGPLMTEWQVPSQLEQQSTSQETLQEIEQALSDEKIVCVSGMGGIGKTTLMKKIYNRLIGTRDFDVVIWATVSKDLNLNAIQKKIGNTLMVEFRENEGMEERRNSLYARLRDKKYMLILDDLWEAFALDEVGIPQPDRENGCKIAITTRSVEVGNRMEADSIIRVKTLSGVEAWELFRSKTGDVVLQPEIQPLAEKVVRECGGLPLAIKTVGGAMRRKGQKELWQNALRALRAPAAPEVPGMEREVFLPLKLSYDCLEDPAIQSCFLYCSLFPEDERMDIAELVKYWAFEGGLINNVSSLDEALNKGHYILARLKDACLLDEADEGHLSSHVRMHDLLRDLAMWIGASKFLAKAGEGLQQPPEEKMWEGERRISLMSNHITELQMTPNCPDLVYLSLSNNFRLHTIHNSFFQLMPKLQILDLRETGIESLPPSLSQLENLRVLDASRCGNLQDVPPLGHLKELKFLSLAGTGIKSLPQGIASLTKLRSLGLSETEALATIPCGIISGLTSLEDLGLYSNRPMMNMEIWREVATLPRLTKLRIILPSLEAFSADDMKHPMWSRLSGFVVQFGHSNMSRAFNYLDRKLVISDWEELPIEINGLMEKAEELIIRKCKSLESLTQMIGDSTSMREAGENNAVDPLKKPSFQQLKRISISGCPKLRCIFSSSMLQHLHPLESLTVSDCEEIVEIVERGPLSDTALQRLRDLSLHKLPKLERISVFARQISISACPKLRCIFSSSMLQHLLPLESLTVYNCEEIVEIVEGGPPPDTALQRLRHLALEKLPKLERIFVSACQISNSADHKLRCIFSSSMLQHLQFLESLTVSDCEEIVEIVEGGPLPDTVILPRLRRVYISHCHKLRCIFSSSMLQHLHLLESLDVYNCGEIVEFVEGGLLPDMVILPKLKSISISGRHKSRCIFSSSMLQHLQSLESLTVSNCEEIVEFVEGGPLPDMVILPKLRSISISGCHKLRCIFSSSMLQHLQSLESLIIRGCEEIVEIAKGGPLPHTVILPKLRSISICGCGKLRCIFSSSMLHLKSLKSRECEEIVEFVEGGPLPDMVVLPKLKSISIFGCHKLRCIFSSSVLQHLQSLESLIVHGCKEIVEIVEGGPLPDTVILPKLRSISICGCRKLRCIFSSSMRQHLQSLESLTVSDCEEIVEIVEGGPLPDAPLQRLDFMELMNLKKLRTICSQQLVLTSMKMIEMNDCPELKKLPVLCSGIQEIRGKIEGAREWWEGIEWEDKHSKSLYSTIYIERQEVDERQRSQGYFRQE